MLCAFLIDMLTVAQKSSMWIAISLCIQYHWNSAHLILLLGACGCCICAGTFVSWFSIYRLHNYTLASKHHTCVVWEYNISVCCGVVWALCAAIQCDWLIVCALLKWARSNDETHSTEYSVRLVRLVLNYWSVN